MRLVLILSLFMIAGCASEPRPTSPPQPKPAVIIAKPAPAPVATPADWIDRPITPGDWVYRNDDRGSVALFGQGGADADFLIRCVLATKRIYLSRGGGFPEGVTGQMTIRASTGLKTYGVANNGDTPPYVSAFLTPDDQQLDAIAFSRGRFLVAVKGAADLIIPAWPEITRVIEDCRA
jgi:hypothetical protein